MHCFVKGWEANSVNLDLDVIITSYVNERVSSNNGSRGGQTFRKRKLLFGLALFLEREVDVWALLERLESFPPHEHVSTKAVAFAVAVLAEFKSRFAMISHEPSITMADKEQLLRDIVWAITEQLGILGGAEIKPLKTLTLKVINAREPAYFLVSGPGDFRIDSRAKKDLSPHIKKMLGTGTNVMSGDVRINPPEFDTEAQIGLKPGIINPFGEIEHFSRAGIRGVLYYRYPEDSNPVAVALSASDTFIVHGSNLPPLLYLWYGRPQGVPFQTINRSVQSPPGEGKLVLLES